MGRLLILVNNLKNIGKDYFKAPVAQLDRAPDFGSGGSGFDSLQARQN